MKVKAMKNFFLFSGERIELNSEYDMKDEIANDLIRGGFVSEIKPVVEKKVAKTKTVKEKKVEE